MTGSNHLMAGALIGTVVTQPAIALPLAVASHFVMDALPHYGDNNNRSWLGRHFNYILGTDAFLAISVIGLIMLTRPEGWVLMLAAGILAVLPDFVWLKYYMADLRKMPIEHGPFARFSKWIQWGERPWGIAIEIVTFVSLLAVFIYTAY